MRTTSGGLLYNNQRLHITATETLIIIIIQDHREWTMGKLLQFIAVCFANRIPSYAPENSYNQLKKNRILQSCNPFPIGNRYLHPTCGTSASIWTAQISLSIFDVRRRETPLVTVARWPPIFYHQLLDVDKWLYISTRHAQLILCR